MAISWNQGITLKHRSVTVILREATVMVQTWNFLVSWHGPWWSQWTYRRKRVLPFETHFLPGISIRQAFDWHRYLEIVLPIKVCSGCSSPVLLMEGICCQRVAGLGWQHCDSPMTSLSWSPGSWQAAKLSGEWHTSASLPHLPGLCFQLSRSKRRQTDSEVENNLHTSPSSV